MDVYDVIKWLRKTIKTEDLCDGTFDVTFNQMTGNVVMDGDFIEEIVEVISGMFNVDEDTIFGITDEHCGRHRGCIVLNELLEEVAEQQL